MEARDGARQIDGALGLGESGQEEVGADVSRIVTDKIARNPEKSLGLKMSVPLGLRSELAKLRQQKLALARSEAILQDLELEHNHSLSDAVQNLHASYKLMCTASLQARSASQQVEEMQVQFENGGVDMNLLLDAERRMADARVAYFQSLLQYNFSILEVHFQKGTLLQEYNVQVAPRVPS